MTDKNININDDDLNELLRKSFLEDDADKFNVDISKVVFSQNYDVKIDPEKEKNLMNRFSGKAVIGKGLIYGIMISVTLVVTGVILFLVYHKSSTSNEKKNTNTIKEQIINNTENSNLNAEQHEVLSYFAQESSDKKKKNVEISTDVNEAIRSFITLPVTNPVSLRKQADAADTTLKELFVLNPKLIQRYWKIKQMMMDELLNKDKKLYQFVPDGSINYKGNQTGITAFTIRNCVVTNLEYRTFLIDLLIQNRKSDYDIAKVKSEIWNNYKYTKLAADYFKAEKYNDFPVVNISQEGADLFCHWLEQETKKYAKAIKKNFNEFKLRLPYDSEWMVLAKYGYASLPDNAGYLTIFDINEGYIDKSLERRIQSIQKRYKVKEPVDEYYAINRYGMKENEVLNIFNKGLELRSAEPYDTIYPERMKDYTLIGHVSEMICEKETGKQIVFGTSWRNKEEFQDMMQDFTKFSSSPYVGMRIVVMYENAPEYKNPIW